jgi:hypothetical protein
MNKFTDIDELSKQFTDGYITSFNTEIILGETTFSYNTEFNIPLIESQSLDNKAKMAVVYNDITSEQYLVLAWALNDNMQVLPTSVHLVHDVAVINEVDTRDIARHYEERTIGKSLDVVLMGINGNQPIKCKVDTGAEMCSLDAQNISIIPNQYEEGELVRFTFQDRTYTVPLYQQQTVQTADAGITYRPVIKLSIKADGHVYSEILFNLNDRSDMPDPVLLGLTFLTKSDYLIDPKKESIDVDWMKTMVEGLPAKQADNNTSNENEKHLSDLLEAIYSCPTVTFADIIKHMKTDTLRMVEGLQY